MISSSSKSIYGNNKDNNVLLVFLVQMLKTLIRSLRDILMILHDMLNDIEYQIDQLITNCNMEQDDVGVDDDSSCGEPIAIPVAVPPDALPQVKDVTTDNKLHTRSSGAIIDPNVIEDSSVAAPIDVNNHCIIDLWDDFEREEINPAAKILNRDLWLTNAEDEIDALLERFIAINMYASDFMSFGGPSLIIIIMNKFKTNELILCKCCEVMEYFLTGSGGDNRPIITYINQDTRFMRCIVQCMNQFPTIYDIQGSCLELLNLITMDNRVGADHLLFDIKRNDSKDSISGLQSVLSALKEFPMCYMIQGIGCSVLWNIAYKEHHMKIREHGAICILASALESHKIDKAANVIQRLLEND